MMQKVNKPELRKKHGSDRHGKIVHDSDGIVNFRSVLIAGTVIWLCAGLVFLWIGGKSPNSVNPPVPSDSSTSARKASLPEPPTRAAVSAPIVLEDPAVTKKPSNRQQPLQHDPGDVKSIDDRPGSAQIEIRTTRPEVKRSKNHGGKKAIAREASEAIDGAVNYDDRTQGGASR